MKDKYKLIIVLLLLLIGIFFIILNFTDIIKLNKKIITTTKVTTTLPLGNNEIFEETIYLEGEKETVKYRTYESYFGYKVNYMVDYFGVATSSNSTIISALTDNTNYIKIEKVAELVYSNESSTLNEEVKDGYKYEYSFIKGNKVYLKITKCYIDSSEYAEGIGTRMDYIINSISI